MKLFAMNKPKTCVAMTFILLMLSVMLTAMPIQAQIISGTEYNHGGAAPGTPNGSVPLPAGVTPGFTVVVTPYLSFSPNPIGVGQTLLVNMWLNPANDFRRYFTNYTVSMIKPDGTAVTVGPLNSYAADTTSYFTYSPDQVGTWQLRFNFPGGFYPAGIVTQPAGLGNAGYSTNFTLSCYYPPAQTAWQNLTVQQAMVQSWPPAPLPTDYWTRPVTPDNREWYSIMGDFPWRGPGGGPTWPANTNTHWDSNYAFTPYVQAPNTCHIVWRKEGAIGGLVGGDNGIVSFTAGGGNPTIVYQGRCYQTITKPMPTTVNGTQVVEPVSTWECYDLRTGQVYWDQTGVTAPSYIEYVSGDLLAQVAGGGAVAVSGATSTAQATTNSLVAISGNRLLKYDPNTGVCSTNVSIPVFATNTYYANAWVLSVQSVVPSTGTGPGPNGRQYLINWTTAGSTPISLQGYSTI